MRKCSNRNHALCINVIVYSEVDECKKAFPTVHFHDNSIGGQSDWKCNHFLLHNNSANDVVRMPTAFQTNEYNFTWEVDLEIFGLSDEP